MPVRVVRYPNHVPDELPSHPGRVLARLARQIELALSATDLTLPQYRVLILLCERKEEASALADKLGVSRPSVTGVVDGLVARGLVQRRHDPEDRRRVRHWLTLEGRGLLAHADLEVQLRLRQIAELMPDAADPFAGLERWQGALDAHRVRCAAARCAPASAITDAGAGPPPTAAPAPTALSTVVADAGALPTGVTP